MERRGTDVADGEAEPALPEGVRLRVLLVSPVPSLDPPSGDVTYTRQLLAAPPPGVVYTTYDEAIAEGTLAEVGTRASLRSARGLDRVGQALVAAARKAEWLIRRSGLGFREQIRVFRVTPGSFDLVHVHVFHHRFLGSHPPVVASAGGPLRWVYADAWGWSKPRVALAEWIDVALGRLWDATICGARLGRADLFIGPSDYLREWLVTRGWEPDKIAVQPNYLAVAETPQPRVSRTPRVLGFVARDFTAKGGNEVLEAFGKLRRAHPNLRLRIVGSTPQMDVYEQSAAGVEWSAEVDRDELLGEILPSIDLLVYPSRFDTGVPYSTMEALAQGIPAVVSDYRSLPDLVGKDAGAVCQVADSDSVAEVTEPLLDPHVWTAASAAATRRFADQFAAHSQAPRLGGLYREVLSRTSGRRAVPPRKRSLRRRNGASTQR